MDIHHGPRHRGIIPGNRTGADENGIPICTDGSGVGRVFGGHEFTHEAAAGLREGLFFFFFQLLVRYYTVYLRARALLYLMSKLERERGIPRSSPAPAT